MYQNRYLILQDINISNVNKEEMDNHGIIQKEGYSNLLFDKHNHDVVGCNNQQSKWTFCDDNLA